MTGSIFLSNAAMFGLCGFSPDAVAATAPHFSWPRTTSADNEEITEVAIEDQLRAEPAVRAREHHHVRLLPRGPGLLVRSDSSRFVWPMVRRLIGSPAVEFFRSSFERSRP